QALAERLPVLVLGRLLEGVEDILRGLVGLGLAARGRRGGGQQGDGERARGNVESLHSVLPSSASSGSSEDSAPGGAPGIFTAGAGPVPPPWAGCRFRRCMETGRVGVGPGRGGVRGGLFLFPFRGRCKMFGAGRRAATAERKQTL